MDIKQLTKKCSKCREVKPLSEFSKRKASRDGSNGFCKKCINEWLKIYYIKNRDRILIRNKKYCENNPEKTKERVKNYYENNKELINKRRKNNKKETKIYQKNYYEKNKEYLLKKNKEYHIKHKKEFNEYTKKYNQERRKTDLKYNLNKRMGIAMWHSLKGNKAGRHWETLVGYTVNDLIKRLKRTMPKGYNWNDYLNGKFEVDHIIPVSVWNFNNPEQINFKRCWALKNLQLLPAKENSRKSNHLDKPFQLSLVI